MRDPLAVTWGVFDESRLMRSLRAYLGVCGNKSGVTKWIKLMESDND